MHGRISLQECEDLSALLDVQIRFLLRLHPVEDRGPVLPLAGLVRAVAGRALRPVRPLLLREGTRWRRAAGRRHRERDAGAKPHRLNPSTERTKVAPALSPRPNPAPICNQSLLEADDSEGPAKSPPAVA